MNQYTPQNRPASYAAPLSAKRLWGAACSAVAALGICVGIIVAIAGGLWGYNRLFSRGLPPGDSDYAVEPDAIPTIPVPAPVVVGEMQVTQEGGVFSYQGITIELLADTVLQPEVFEVLEQAHFENRDPAIVYQSPIYSLAGKVQAITGDILISFAIPAEAFAQPYDSEQELADSLVISLETDGYIPSYGGEAHYYELLPTWVDLNSRTASASLANPFRLHASASSAKLASPESFLLPLRQPVVAGTVGFRLSRYKGLSTVGNDYFRVFLGDTLSAADGALILDALDKQMNILKSLNVDFTRRSNWPIPIEVKDLNSPTTWEYFRHLGSPPQKDIDAMASYSSANNGKIYLDVAFARGGDFTQPQAVATLGHEFFHLVQAMYYDYQNDIDRYVWLDEATATWFEGVAVGDPLFLPATVDANRVKFTRQPLFNPAGGTYLSEQGHGYGASMFLRYLANKYGLDLPVRVYGYASNPRPEGAFEQALWDYQDVRAGTLGEWPDFLETYYIYPSTLALNLPYEVEHSIVLRSFADAYRQGAFTYGFESLPDSAHDRKIMAAVNYGSASSTAASPADVTFEFELAGIQAKVINVQLVRSAFFDNISGTVRIDLETEQFGGLMAYGFPTKDIASAAVLAGSGNPLKAGRALAVAADPVSTRAGEFQQLMLIAYSTGTISHPVRFKIRLTYQPVITSALPVAVNTPTPKSSSATLPNFCRQLPECSCWGIQYVDDEDLMRNHYRCWQNVSDGGFNSVEDPKLWGRSVRNAQAVCQECIDYCAGNPDPVCNLTPP